MKNLGCIFLFILFCGFAQGQKATVTDNSGATWLSFGKKINTENVISSTQLTTYMKGKKKAKVKVEGDIVVCCQKKGCWMDIKIGNGKTMTVRFKDYAFFVPKDAAGKRTIIQGKVERKTMSVEWLKHKAEDAGKSHEYINTITEPKESLEFTATGVLIAATN